MPTTPPASTATRFNLLALAGLGLLAFAAFRPVATANYAFGLLLLWLAANWYYCWQQLKREPLFWLTAGFLLYLLLLSLVKQNPAGDFRNWRHALENMMKAGFAGTLLVAIAYRAKPVNTRRLAFCMLIGLLLQIVSDPRFWQAEYWLGAWRGERLWRFKLGFSANSLGLWCNVMLVALVTILRPRFEFSLGRNWRPLILYAGVCLLLIIVLLLSHSRVAWFTLPVGLLPLAWERRGKISCKQGLLGLGLGLMLAATIISLPAIRENYALEKTAFQKMLQGRGQNIESESLGDRLTMLRFFAEKWPRQPLTGYGPGSTPRLLQKASSRPAFTRISPYRHIHNSYLQILLETGILGLFFYLFFWGKVVFSLHRKTGAEACWLKSSLLMLAVFALFNHPLDSHQAPTVTAILSGLALFTTPNPRQTEKT